MQKATVLAQQLASDNGIDLSLVGKRPDEEITETDVLQYLTRVMSGEAEPPSEPVDPPPPDWDGQMPAMPIEALKSAGIESELTAFVEHRVAQPPRRDDVRPPAPARPAQAAVSTLTIPAVTTPPVTPTRPPEQPVAERRVAPVTHNPAPAAPVPVTPVASAPSPVAPAPVTPPAPVAPAAAAAPRGMLGNLTSLITSMYKKDPPSSEVAVPAPLPQAPAADPDPITPAPVAQAAPADVPVPAPTADAEPTPHPAPAPAPEAAAPLPSPAPAAAARPGPAPTPAPLSLAPAPLKSDAPEVADAEVTPDLHVAPAPARAPLLLSPRSTVTVRVNADVTRFTAVYTQLCEALSQDVDVADLVTISVERSTGKLLGGLVVGTVRHNLLTTLPRTGTVRERLTGPKRTLDDADVLIVNTSSASVEEIIYHDRTTVCVHHDPAQGKLIVSVHGELAVARALAVAVADDLSLPVRLLV